ncbi:MAG: LysR family transcriptional regulator [Tannerellaceae bacterium]|jgi:LysR family hydrogen peroxide-inducible transcriptional activator|nr:LysR family transcriptional regulator [Tannerellaceae bacterium]
MTILQLEYFLAVVNHGGFSGAAEYCFATQPALSRQISMLEEELGALLIDRTKRPIVLTDAGELFIDGAKQTVEVFYMAKNRINDLKGDFQGKLKVGIIPTISPYLTPGFVAHFTKLCPNVKLDIIEMYTADITDSLTRGLIDVAILSGGQSEFRIKETELFNDRLYLYVARDNELYGRKSVEVNEIDVKKLLILSKGNCLRNQTLKLCQERKKIELQYDFISCSLETLMHTADNIDGMTIIPGMSIGYIPKDKYDQIIPFESKRAFRKITMAIGHTFVREPLIAMVEKSVMDVRQELDVAEFLIHENIFV